MSEFFGSGFSRLRFPRGAGTLQAAPDEGGTLVFLKNARRLLESAATAARAGFPPSDMVVLIGSSGAIEMIAGSDWPLESLRLERGARMAFRVRPRRGKVRVEGCDGGESCLLETEAVTPAGALRQAVYSLAPAGGEPAARPAAAFRLASSLSRIWWT